MADSKTLAVYDERAGDHAVLCQASGLLRSLRDFLARRADLLRHLTPSWGAGGGVETDGGFTYRHEDRKRRGARRPWSVYTYVTPTELSALLTDQGLKVLWTEEGCEVGLAGTEDGFVLIRAEKPQHG